MHAIQEYLSASRSYWFEYIAITTSSVYWSEHTKVLIYSRMRTVIWMDPIHDDKYMDIEQKSVWNNSLCSCGIFERTLSL